MRRFIGLLVLFSLIPLSDCSHRHALRPGEHFADVNGVRLSYVVQGKGPIVVVQAPGWGVGSAYLRNGLQPLTDNFTVLFYDTRGSGRSTRPTDESRMSTSQMVDDLEQLRRYWNLQSIALLGHSHGGSIALEYAIRYADRVSKLVLVDSSVEPWSEFQDEIKKNVDSRRGDPRFASAISEMDRKTPWTTDEEFRAGLERLLPIYFYDPERYVPQIVKTRSRSQSVWVWRTFNAAEDKAPLNELAELENVKATTLVIAGRQDFCCGPTVAEKIRSGIPHSKLIVFDQCGHLPWIEASSGFFREVNQFLGAN